MSIVELRHNPNFKAASSVDQLMMLIGSYIDHGGPKGGMVSVKQFEDLAEDILVWESLRAIAEKQKKCEQ